MGKSKQSAIGAALPHPLLRLTYCLDTNLRVTECIPNGHKTCSGFEEFSDNAIGFPLERQGTSLLNGEGTRTNPHLAEM